MDLIPNGGRSLTLGGRKFDVISGYTPSWTKETVEEFVDYTGKYRTLYKGVRFSLRFSTYGMTPADVAAIKSILMDSEEIQLACDEYTGAVTCGEFSPDVKSANFLGDFSRTDITLTAVNIIEGGKVVTLGGVTFVVTENYTPTWTNEYADSFIDYTGHEVKLSKGVRFSLTFSVKGVPPAVLSQIKTALMNPDENGITLSCSEYSGKVTCDSFSASLQTASSLGEYFSPNITVEAVNIIEGGKVVTLGGIEFVVTENYTPTWTNEYADTFTDYQGKEVKLSKGVRFSLTFSVKGVPPGVLMQIEAALMNPGENGIELSCSEYSGEVTCDSFSGALQTASDLGEYYAPNITVQAVNTIEGGKAVTLGGVNFVVREEYSPAWSKEYAESFTTYDGRVIKPLKGVRFSLSFSPKGIPPEVLATLRDNVALAEKASLTCPEFTGDVICETLSADLQHASTLGEYFGAGINLTAVNAELPEDGL